MNDFYIYIKLTNGCNLKCKHCYNTIMKNSLAMSNDTLNKTVEWLKDFRQKNPDALLNMSLHGGEPMLQKKKILKLLDATKDLDLKWCITTNLSYPLDEECYKIFEQMKPFDDKPMIMTSYDFGDTRFESEDEINLWKNNVLEIVSKGIDVQPIICVTDYVVKNIEPQQVFDLLKELGLKRFNFERITETGRASENHIKPLNREVDKWLLNAYKIYETLDEIVCPIFEGVEQSLKGVFLGCRARKCMEKVITINPDGTLSSCPNMANNTYGNLYNINYPKKCALIEFEKQKELECLMCPFYNHCNGDCCQLTFDESGCPGLKMLYNHLLYKK